jgi:hypothetical protein
MRRRIRPCLKRDFAPLGQQQTDVIGDLKMFRGLEKLRLQRSQTFLKRKTKKSFKVAPEGQNFSEII